nr:EOG090X0464 [Eulimnadia texana]
MPFSSDSSGDWTPLISQSRRKKQLKTGSSAKSFYSSRVDLGKLSLKKPTMTDSSKTLKPANIFSSCGKEKAQALSSEVLADNSDDESLKVGKKSRVQLWLDSGVPEKNEDFDYADLAVPITKTDNAGNASDSSDETDDLEKCLRSLRINHEEQKIQDECIIISSSDDDEAFENFLQSLKTPKQEVKKTLVTSASFICDDTLSDISDEAFYLKSLNERIQERVGGHFQDSEKKKVRRSKSEADLRRDSEKNFNYREITFSEDDLFLKTLSERVGERTGKKKPKAETQTPKTDRKKNKENEAPKSSKKSGKFIEPSTGSVSFLASLSINIKPELRHRETIPYVSNFRKTRNELTQRLFVLFNKEVFRNRLPADFPISWNSRLTRTAGYCRHVMKKIDGKTICESSIELSVKVVDTPCRLRDTLIHELCHAATWMLDECRGGHGPIWRSWANHARSVFPELPPISRCHNYEITYKYRYKCTVCSYSIGRHSKSIDTSTRVCPFCRNRLQLNSDNGDAENEGSAKKTPNRFALFVKENYAATKEGNSHLSHGEIMKVLSQKFAQTKAEA